MEEFDLCLELNKKLKELDEKISDITAAAYAPKNQVFSDMPRGGSPTINATERYIIKREELMEKRVTTHNQISKYWGRAYRAMKQKGISSEDCELMRYRFYHGLPWKKCVVKMRDEYGKHWNINRVFRVYRNVLAKCTK